MAQRCFEPHFEIAQEDIGRGNFSNILLCRPCPAAHNNTNGGAAPPVVAVKRCAKSNEEQLRVLRAEWAAFNTLNQAFGVAENTFGYAHPHIVGAFGFCENDHEAAIILEYATHGDLMRYVQTRRLTGQRVLSEVEIRAITGQLLDALSLIHNSGFVHRDVKPHNLLVVSERPITVKLTDFGLAKKVGATNLWARQNSAGDYDIMPPDVKERTRDGVPMKRRDYFKSDTYAVGVTLFYLVAGALPTSVDLMELAMGPETSSKRWPHVSMECLELLALLLSPSAEERPTADEALVMSWFGLTTLREPSDHMTERERTESVTYSEILEREFTTCLQLEDGADGDADADQRDPDDDDGADQ